MNEAEFFGIFGFAHFFLREEGKTGKTYGFGKNKQTRKKAFFFCNFELLAVDCLLDFLHDGVDLNVASRVDGPALLLASLAADVGSNVVEDGGQGDVDGVGLAEGGGDGELILLEHRNRQ